MSKTGEALPTTWTTLWTDALNTGTWRSAIPEYLNRPSPCHLSCPVNGEIPTWIEALRKGELKESWLSLARNNPFPGITGRVCHHPCEESCNRTLLDEKVSIKQLERYIGDLALKNGWPLPAKEGSLDQRVAVVGGGPAGLAAAYHLARRGFAVELFEAQPHLGGLMRYAIPPYRLDREILDRELERLLQLEIGVHSGARIAGAEELERLSREYSAVFLATGAQLSRKLPGLEGSSGIMVDGLRFLYRYHSGNLKKVGRKVAVIGGGNTALDAARVARRLGAASVTVVYRRTEEQMPCRDDEIREAREEGVNFRFLAAPLRFERENGADNLVCGEMRLAGKDESGRFSPELLEGACLKVEVDEVIVAIGSDPLNPQLGLECFDENNLLQVNDKQETATFGVYAGGDLTSLERFVSSAMGTGKKAAESIALRFGCPAEDNNTGEEAVTFEEVNTFYFSHCSRINAGLLKCPERLNSFDEIEKGYTGEEAVREAERCFMCGRCIECDNCYYYCPDMAVKKGAPGEVKYSVLDRYCKGCGLCVRECPRGAVVLREERR